MLQDRHGQSCCLYLTTNMCCFFTELDTAETRPKVLQHSHHLLRQGAPLQLASVVIGVVWRAPRRILYSPFLADDL